MKYFITYGNDDFRWKKYFASFMAKVFGKFDKCLIYSPEDIDEHFSKKYELILKQKRGNGYWLWKPYFILKSLEKLNYGDYLFYCDAGGAFLKPVDILIKEMNFHNQDIMGYEINLIEEQWTKKELFFCTGLYNEHRITKSNQIMSGCILIKKTDFSVKFFKEVLEIASNEINITDKLNLVQDDIYIEHRHDQSIFSILYKKYNLKAFKDPSQWGTFPERCLNKSRDMYEYGKIFKNGKILMRVNAVLGDYDVIIYLYRRSNPLIKILKYKIRRFINDNLCKINQKA